MSSSFVSTPSIQSLDIVLINRISNAQTSITARAFRSAYRPTHHAKKRATRLNLTVSIEKARNLDQKYISTIPLPALELSPPASTQQAPALLLSNVVVGREREMKRLARPVLRCDIPQDVKVNSRTLSSTTSSGSSDENSGSAKAPCVLRGQNIPWVGVTSCWSASTDGDESSPDRCSVYSFDSVEDEFCLSDSNEYETDGSSSEDADNRLPVIKELPLEIDLGSYGWESGRMSGDSPLSFSSNGPVTPEEQESVQPSVVIRVKRSIPSDLVELGEETMEKRPKYERKSWASRARRTVNMSSHDSKA